MSTEAYGIHQFKKKKWRPYLIIMTNVSYTKKKTLYER